MKNIAGFLRTTTIDTTLALDMMERAATYGLHSKLNGPFQTRNTEQLDREVLAWADGDIRVKDDTIVETFYGYLKNNYPQQFL